MIASNLRLIDMQTFITLARTGHFGRAAEELGTTQPTISTRLSRLEAHFGCRLAERADRAFALTHEGAEVLRGLAGILDQLATLRARVVAPETAPLEIVRIGVIDSVSATWMPHFVESLQARFPGLGIDLSVASTESLMQDMRADELDLIFAVDPLIAEECRSFVSCVLEMSWVAAPRLIAPGTIYPVDALAQMQIVSFQKGSPPYRMIAPYFQDENVLASKLITSNSLYAIVNLVIDGFGISAIPTVSITRELAAGLLAVIPVEKRFPPLPIICTYRASRSAGHMREVIEQARISAARFCAAAPAGTAWID